MRVRNNHNAKSELAQCNKYIENKEYLQKILKSFDKKIAIEIGMGKGQFITNMSYKNSDIIYIGIEISKTVLNLAAKKIKRFEEENKINLSNLYIMSFDASELCNIFNNNQVDIIYLNFSDPWPKKKHEKRRLTNKNFLKIYKNILKKDGKIEIKTDNRCLFEYTILSITNSKYFKINEIYLDLHKENIENVMTEYEEKFYTKGPIYKMIVS